MFFLAMTGRTTTENDSVLYEEPGEGEEEEDIVLEEDLTPSACKKEEKERLQRLLAKYNQSSLMDPMKFSGLRRTGTLRGRMIKRVPCPVAPAPSGAFLAVDCAEKFTQQHDLHLNQQQQQLPFPPPPPFEIHANVTVSNNNSHRYSSISSSTATTTSSSSSSSDRSEESEMVEGWLSSIHFEEYVANFLEAGYDLPTISRMTPEDLIAIGITNPVHRKKIKHEITGLSVPDGIPSVIPESLYEWLYLLRLEEYFDLLKKQGYDSVDKVGELTWEDFEEIGIKKLGHQKRLSLAIKRYNTFVKEGGSGSGSCGSGLGSPSDAPGGTTGSHYSSTTTFSNGVGGGVGGRVSVNGSFSDMMMLHSHQLHQQHHGHLPPRPASQLGIATSTPSFRPIVLNSENNFVDFDRTATLQRHQRAAIVGSAVSFLSKGPNAGSKPVAMIAAKSRGSCGSVDTMGGVGGQSQLQDLVNEMKKHHQLSNGGYTQQQPQQPLVGGGHHHQQAPLSTTASTSSLVSAGSLTSCDVSESASLYGVMMPRHSYCQQQLNSYDSNSSIYATLKRGKRPPPPPPKRTNSMKSSSSTSSIIIPPSQSCGNSSVGSPAASCLPANGVTSTFGSAHTRSVNGNNAANHNQHLHQYQQEQNYSPGSTIDPYINYNDSSSAAHVGGQRLYGMVGQYNHYQNQNQQRIAQHQHNTPNLAVDENEDEPPPPPAPHPTSLMPPPPQHQSHHPRSVVDDFQDQAFATCVKSLTSRFSQMSTAADDESPPGIKFFNPPLSSSTSTPSTSSSKPSPSSSSHHTSSSQETLPPPPPPLPPTRVESIQSSTSSLGNNHRHPSSSSSLSGRGGGNFGGSSEFPPPPTPLRQSMEELSQQPASHQKSGDKNSNLETFKTFPLRNNNNSSNMTNHSNNACNIQIINNIQRNGNNKNNIIMNSPDEKSSSPCGSTSSSSSNESLPFANDKVGTIRQSASSHHASSSHSSVNPQSLNCLNGPQPSTPNSTFKPQQPADSQQQRKMETIESLAATLMSMKAAGQNRQGPASPASSCSSNDSKGSSSSSSSNSSSGGGSSSPLSSKIQQFARRNNIQSSPLQGGGGKGGNHPHHHLQHQQGEQGNVVIDDIETMLANLSSQLDAMLEQEITPAKGHL